jgi:signal transduction histidine kinase
VNVPWLSRRTFGGPLYIAVAAGAATTAVVISSTRDDWVVPPTLLVGTAATVLALAASILFYVTWRVAPTVTHGWWAAAALFGCTQALAVPRAGVVDPAELAARPGWLVIANLVSALVLLALVIAGTRARRTPDPLVLGLTLGVAMALCRVAVTGFPPLGLPPLTADAIAAAVTSIHVLVVVVLLRHPVAHGWTTPRVLTLFLLLGSANLAQAPVVHGPWVEGAVAVAQLVGACLFLSVSFALLRDLIAQQEQTTSDLHHRLEEAEAVGRDGKERLHEIRSTVAGISNASRLLHEGKVAAATRRRLDDNMRMEMSRLERLLDNRQPTQPEPVDLDATIDPLLELHRARGRRIVWQPTGLTVRGRRDDIAEVINILLENAATHAADTESRIDVTRDADSVAIRVADSGPGIPPEVRDGIFEWGVRGDGSAGQGIGLNVGRRLLSEQGGSLTLAEPAEPGASGATVRSASGATFVIKLPAARKGD